MTDPVRAAAEALVAFIDRSPDQSAPAADWWPEWHDRFRALRASLRASPQGDAATLREALAECIDLAEEGWGYASEYFAEKWGAKERLAKARAALAASSPSPEAQDVRRAALLEAAKAITPIYGTPGGPTAEQVDSKRDFYPYLGESAWDLLKRAADRLRALAGAPATDPEETKP